MRMITAVIATVGVLGIVAASGPARAHDHDDDDGGWRRQEWREHQWREHQWREQQWRERHAYAPPPVVYAQPGYYPPPPVYYAPPQPTYYAPPPVYGAPGLSIGFSFR